MQREIHNPPAQAYVEAASERELPSAPEMTSHASLLSQSAAPRILGLHEEMLDILPGTVNTFRGTASRVRQMPNIVASNPTDGSFEEILTQTDHQIQGMSIADHKWVKFTDTERMGMTSTTERPEIHGLQDPKDIFQIRKGEDMQLDSQHHLTYQKGLKNSHQLAATEFCKIWEPKITTLKGGYSSNASLIFQSWLRDIQVHVSE